MKSRLVLAVFLALIMVFASVGGVSAAAPSMSGTLLGGGGGAFAKYEMTWATADKVTLTMTFVPDSPVTAKYVGFKVYGPSGEVATSAGTFGKREASFTPAAGTKYLVMVYNYVPVSVSYSIGGAGSATTPDAAAAPAVAAAPAAAAPAAAPAVAAAPAAAAAAMAGSLLGGGGGGFAKYEVTFPSANQVTLTMMFGPDFAVTAKYVGFKIYGPSGEVATAAGTFGKREASFTPTAGTKYLVLAYNYVPVTINYSIGGALGVPVK